MLWTLPGTSPHRLKRRILGDIIHTMTTNVAWLKRVAEDANRILEHMVSAWNRGRRNPWTIGGLLKELASPPMSRDRVYGALVHLHESGRLHVEGDRLDNTTFVPHDQPAQPG